MNDFQNTTKTTLSTIIKWGTIPLILVTLIVIGILLTSSSETSSGFLAKWKNAMESGSIEAYDTLWDNNARGQLNSGYQHTAELFAERFVIEVNISNAVDRTRTVAQYPNYLQIEEIPILVHAIGEPILQSRTLTIAKKGFFRKHWKLVRDEVISEEIGSDLTAFEATRSVGKPPQNNSPVAPLVMEWKEALESQNNKKYSSLWDKSARKKRQNNYQLALAQLSETSKVDLSLATYSPIANSKTKHVVENISVTTYNAGTPIVPHTRRLSVEKKGFFVRRWKLINDEVVGDYLSEQPIPQQQQPEMDSIEEETESGIYSGDAPIDTQLKVGQVLGKWQKAWEDKDLDTYMSIYSDRALITRVSVRNGKEIPSYLTKNQLREKMKRLNVHYSNIQVKISNLVVNGDRAVADLEFLQEFKGTPASGSRPAYSDLGLKQLDLMIDPSDGYWKIYGETWSRYEEVPKFPKN